ncbi:TPA: hypothetical protein DCE37_20755 [Candidatus Latescibacteria bacterium]|nr:hypothetical protein [Candidatus Latescibacterota bacterium]
MDQDKVSVLLAVPADDLETSSVRETMQSIASQSYPASLVETLQVQYMPNIPGGRTAALNAARDQAKGEFLVHTEQGVTWDPSKIEKQVLRLREGGEGAGVGSAHRVSVRDASGRLKQTNFDLIHRVGLRVSSLLLAPWKPGALLIRSDTMADLGAYRHIDQAVWEYDIRLASKGLSVELLDEDLAVWNVDMDPAGSLVRELVPSGMRESFLKRLLDQTAPGDLVAEGGNEFPALLLAGLHLFNDDLETSHTISQSFGRESVAANFWHGVIHRREPDFGNARGWFERARSWEGLLQIRDAVQEVLERVLLRPEYGQTRDLAFSLKQHLDSEGIWDSGYFVDMCERFSEAGVPDEMEETLLRAVQEAEMVAALESTYRCAVN